MLIVQQALRISNDLYSSDVCSAQELAKGYTRPATIGSFIAIVPQEILQAHDDLLAKRKLTRILRSKTGSDIPVKVGDTVQIFIREQKDKRGKWSLPKVILEFDHYSGTVTVPGKNGKTVKAAIEDVRLALSENTFASAIQDGIDTLSRSINDTIDHLESEIPRRDSTEGSDLNNAIQRKAIDSEENVLEDTEENLTSLPSIGDSIEIYWPLDDVFYAGKVSSINNDDNKYNIDYADGEKESLDLSGEVWKYSSQDVMESSNVQALRVNMRSTEQEELTLYVDTFGHKDFMKFQAQGLQSFLLSNAYYKEEESFKDTVETVTISQVPENANVITSHVIYKVKKNDDGSFKMKARIAPHGNKDLDRDQLKTDSAVCPPVGVRILWRNWRRDAVLHHIS